MKNKSFRMMLSALTLCSIWMLTISVNAAPVRFSQVIQVVNAKSGKSSSGNFTHLRVVSNSAAIAADDDDDKKKTAAPQDGRVIVETRSDIVEDDACDCEPIPPAGGGFPKYALLGLAAIPLFFLFRKSNEPPTPTPTTTPTETPTMTPTTTPTTTPTATPTVTPTVTPTLTPTPTATMTPTVTPTPPTMTPTPEPVPEPVTILLFGTGLAGIGVAARKRLRRKDDTTAGE